MSKNFIFRLSFFLFNILSIIITKIIVIPFRSNIPENNITNINQKFSQKSLYSENLIGTPPQTININILQNEYSFYLGENLCTKIPETYYKYFESSTYKEKSNLIYDDDFGKGFLSQEFFSFYNSINLNSNITSSNVPFYFSANYNVNETKQICGDLGLKIKETYINYDYTNSFIDTIKHINLTKDYYWSYIYFEKDKNNKITNIEGINNEYIMKNYEGLLILGESPHEYEPNKYNKSDLKNILASKRYIEVNWDIVFKNIFFLQKNNSVFNLSISVQAALDISSNYILSPYTVFQNITEYFFKDYLNNNICKFNKINNYDYFSTFISCNKKDFNNDDIKKFPTIYFEHADYNFTFNLTCDDLFEEFNDSILFLIYSPEYSTKFWRLGKIFLKKYKFIFNQDSKTIGFYRKNYNGYDKNEHNDGKSAFEFLKEKNFWVSVAWIIACILCLGLGVYFGVNYIKKERKKRANELKDDDYDYSVQNNIN